jgi:hypothetical protein
MGFDRDPRWMSVDNSAKVSDVSIRSLSTLLCETVMTKFPRAVLGRSFLTFGLILSFVVVSAVASAQDQAPGASVSGKGLRGLLAEQVPVDLTEESLESLGGNWAPVRAKLVISLNQLYENESLGIRGQRRALEELKAQAAVIRVGIEELRNKPIQRNLITIHGRLSRRIGVAEALLDAVTISTKAAPAVSAAETARQKLTVSVRKLHGYLKSFATGETWIDYLGVVRISEDLKKPTPGKSGLAVMRRVQERLQGKDQIGDAAQTKFLKEPQIAAVEEALGAYLTEAGKPTPTKPRPVVPLNDKTRAALRPHLATLAAAIDRYELSSSKSAATRVRQALKSVQTISPSQGEQLGEALRPLYLSYNLRVVASEKLLGRIIGQTRTKKKPVRDVILEAQVTGDSTTSATVGIDLLKSQRGARWNMVLNGKTITDTRANKKGVNVFTHGEHTFSATKLVEFDGDRFSTKPAVVDVDANNTIVDVTAKSVIIRRLAKKKAAKLNPQTERIAAQKVAADVSPEFNGEVDKQFKKATTDLAKHVNGPLKQLDLFPAARSITTTNDELRVSTQLMGSGELAGGRPNPAITSDSGLVVHLHESAINNALDRLKLAGRTMTEEDLKVEFEKTLSTFLGREFHFPAADARSADETGPTTLVFAGEDPIRVRIADGKLFMVIRAGLKQESGKEEIPAQVVTVPFGIGVDGDNVVLSRGSVKVSAVSRPKSRTKQIVRAGVVRKKITRNLKNRLIERHMSVPRDGADSIRLSVTRVEAINGWLSIVFE